MWTPNLLTGDGFFSLAGGSRLPCGMGEVSKKHNIATVVSPSSLPQVGTNSQRLQGVPQGLGSLLFYTGEFMFESHVNLDRAGVHSPLPEVNKVRAQAAKF